MHIVDKTISYKLFAGCICNTTKGLWEINWQVEACVFDYHIWNSFAFITGNVGPSGFYRNWCWEHDILRETCPS